MELVRVLLGFALDVPKGASKWLLKYAEGFCVAIKVDSLGPVNNRGLNSNFPSSFVLKLSFRIEKQPKKQFFPNQSKKQLKTKKQTSKNQHNENIFLTKKNKTIQTEILKIPVKQIKTKKNQLFQFQTIKHVSKQKVFLNFNFATADKSFNFSKK